MNQQRYKITPAVFVMLFNNHKQILLHRRFNAAYMNGFYDFPGGHLEEGESLVVSAARELYEEACIKISPDNLKLFHINQNSKELNNPYINFVFWAPIGEGEPQIGEPHKCDAIGYFSLDNLPKITPIVEQALKAWQSDSGLSLSYLALGA